ncbi:Rap1a/Tai family immunity protein [Roseibium sp.]|uniref:Rap1a/Tai family immunity protein n=1 Tax=Roseibium sp. TaxID=1936156 RepID=UPI003A97D51C
MRVAVLLVCSLLFTTPSFGGAMNGNEFLAICKGEPGNRPLTCKFFVAGVIQALWVGAMRGAALATGETPTIKKIDEYVGFCQPEGVSTSQALEIAYKFMQEHPENLHFPVSAIIRDALARSFPCSSS